MPQTYANHKRHDPWYHYAASALLLLILVQSIRHLLQHRPGSITQLFLLALVTLLLLKVRSYALRVQDRVIRLEETLRMKALLPEARQGDILRLTPSQFVALRFASDGELSQRVEEAVQENLASDAIKKRIQTWRPDEFRV